MAEDDLAGRTIFKKLAQTKGWQVSLAENGQEALDLFKEQTFDLVFMDIQMPIMDGYEATRAIQKYEKTLASKTPIIALTAHALEGDREKCLHGGMDDYLSKPLNLDALDEMMMKWT